MLEIKKSFLKKYHNKEFADEMYKKNKNGMVTNMADLLEELGIKRTGVFKRNTKNKLLARGLEDD